MQQEAPTVDKQSSTCSLPLIHSVWISFVIISFTLGTSIVRCWSLTWVDDFKVSTRDVLSVLLKTPDSLGNLNVSVAREIMHASALICLACKMRSGREKWAMGKIKLTSSQLWIVFDISTHVNCMIDPDVAFWHNYISPAWMYQNQKVFWVLMTHNKRRAWV